VNSKGYKFYFLSYSIRIIEVINVKFLEDLIFSGSDFPRNIEFEETQDSIKLHKYKRQLVIFQENHLDDFEQQPI
jgi:hypothetical protein